MGGRRVHPLPPQTRLFFYPTLFSFLSSTLSSLSLPFFPTCVLLPTTTFTFADEATCTYTRTPGRTHARTLQGYCIYVANRRTAPLLRRLTQNARKKRGSPTRRESSLKKKEAKQTKAHHHRLPSRLFKNATWFPSCSLFYIS